MNSKASKMLVQLCRQPIVQYIIRTLDRNICEKKIVVLGNQAEEVRETIELVGADGISYVVQDELLGTVLVQRELEFRLFPTLCGSRFRDGVGFGHGRHQPV